MAILGDFLIVRRLLPFAKSGLVGEPEQNDFFAVPRAFDDLGFSSAASTRPRKRDMTPMKRL